NKILSGWNGLGWATPVLTEELQPDYVVLTLPVGKSKLHQETPKCPPKLTEADNPTNRNQMYVTKK
ncbi:MAG: hypothetical protein PUA96_07960, partial [Bacteroidales bacterium]|nr:hypothetical protein [Bacteroidales bacterium]